MEKVQYRDFSEFCEELNDIKRKFHKWDSCEKTVALYYLMVGLPFGNAKFLQHALEQCIVAVNSTETQTLEENANDSSVILNFLVEQPHVVLSLLLSHLPLLKPGNKRAAKCYLKVIRQILLEFVTPAYKIYNECVEIMSYVYIHPAFSNEDKMSFKTLLKQVLNRVSPDTFIHSFGTESSDESLSPSSDIKQNVQRNGGRSYSLTPVLDIASPKPPSKPRSYSLCNDKLLNTVITDAQANKSEIRLQDLILRNSTPAMKSIISWLKSLRLHKYSWVFNNLTYRRMINLTDETLQAIGITKGARHKLLISITKLKERSTLLSELETGIMKGGDINIALKKLKNILQTPLEITMDNEDLPSQFVKVMGKVCTQLLMSRQPTDEYLLPFSSLCERAESMDSFSDEQKNRMNVWKTQLLKDMPVSVISFSQQYSKKLCTPNDSSPSLPNVSSFQSSYAYAKKSSSFPNMKTTIYPIKNHRHSVGSVTLQNQLYSIPQSQLLFKHYDIKGPFKFRAQIYDPLIKMNNSMALQDFQKDKECRTNNDIESSLESLCIQMMEHALGP